MQAAAVLSITSISNACSAQRRHRRCIFLSQCVESLVCGGQQRHSGSGLTSLRRRRRQRRRESVAGGLAGGARDQDLCWSAWFSPLSISGGRSTHLGQAAAVVPEAADEAELEGGALAPGQLLAGSQRHGPAHQGVGQHLLAGWKGGAQDTVRWLSLPLERRW